ncbi:MAG: glycosyltransferase, partial [Bacteroidota bacterium]
MEKKIKILQIAPRFPFPTDDGGKIGIANIFREFSEQNCEVTFFCFVGKNENINEYALNEAIRYGEVILFEHSTENTPLRILKSFLYNQSIYLKKHNNKSIEKAISNMFENRTFDIIHADHSAMAPLALRCKNRYNIPVGLRLHNVEYLIWERYAENLKKNSPKYIFIKQQALALKKAESWIYKNADVCFAITEPDKHRALEIQPDANIIVASAGVNAEEWHPEPDIERNPFELILATTYHWIHNVNALKWFLDNVYPKVREKIPDISLTLIGKEAPEWLRDYQNQSVNLVGYVDKVQPYLNKAGIYIAPLFVGAGIRIKILEAMAMELPVVASPVAAEGIEANESQGLFI